MKKNHGRKEQQSATFSRQKQAEMTKWQHCSPSHCHHQLFNASASGSNRFWRWFRLKGHEISKNLPVAESICNNFAGKMQTKTIKQQHQPPNSVGKRFEGLIHPKCHQVSKKSASRSKSKLYFSRKRRSKSSEIKHYLPS